MAFITGSAASISDLLTAIRNACTSNGWTLAGNVLSKGTCYQRLQVSGSQLDLISGTGIDGSNNLLGAADDQSCRLGFSNSSATFAYPVDYFIHINTSPDEIYTVVRYSGSWYQFLAWGQSSHPGLSGTGNWYTGSQNATFAGSNTVGNSVYNSGLIVENFGAAGMFQGRQYAGNRQNGAVDHKLDSVTWKVEGAWRDWYSPFILSPNAFNSRSILIPIRVYAPRTSGFVSVVLECAHSRFVNAANLSAEQIITLGSDKWKIYPWWSKNPPLAIANCAHAFRYDGP